MQSTATVPKFLIFERFLTEFGYVAFTTTKLAGNFYPLLENLKKPEFTKRLRKLINEVFHHIEDSRIENPKELRSLGGLLFLRNLSSLDKRPIMFLDQRCSSNIIFNDNFGFRKEYYENFPVGSISILMERWVISPKVEERCKGIDGIISPYEFRIIQAIYTADCIPLIFVGKEKNTSMEVFGAIHISREFLIQEGLEKLRKIFDQFRPLIIGIGPSICGKCYKFDKKFFREKVLPRIYSSFLENFVDYNASSGMYHFDIRSALIEFLKNIGIKSSQIENLNYCTYERQDLFFSYRRGSRKQDFATLITPI